ncbi:MAG: MATE family efflux transporter [Bilophila wadsworthia]
MHGLDLMLHGPLVRTFLRYCIPWTLAMLLQSSAAIVDGFFVGRYVGAMSLAALNLVMPMFSLFFGVGVMLASGGAVRAGKYLGEKRPEAASAIFTKTMLSLLLVGLAASAGMLLFSGELVRFLGADEELRGPAEAYLRGLMFFGPMIPCGLALSYFVRVNGKPALASVGLMLSALINIVLDAVFIPVFGMGVEGAAYATGIAYTITTGVLCLHFFTPEAKCRFTRAIGAWKEVGQACWNGVSELINETSIGLVILFINWILLARIGSYGVAAFTIINYAAWFGASVSYAISDSLSPLVSANFGARNFARARQFLGLALGMVFGIGLMLYGLFALYPEMLLKIFLPGEEKVVAVTLEFIDWFKLAFLFSGLNMALASFFTALHMAAASCGGSHAQLAFSGGLPVAVAATVRQCGYLRSHTVGGNVHAGRGEPDLCGQPETFCRSQGAPRPGAGGTGRKKSVAADCAGGTQWNTGLPQWRGSPWFLMPCGLISLF